MIETYIRERPPLVFKLQGAATTISFVDFDFDPGPTFFTLPSGLYDSRSVSEL